MKSDTLGTIASQVAFLRRKFEIVKHDLGANFEAL